MCFRAIVRFNCKNVSQPSILNELESIEPPPPLTFQTERFSGQFL